MAEYFACCVFPATLSPHELCRDEVKGLYERCLQLNDGRLIVHGLLARADAVNVNKRSYPKPLLAREVRRYLAEHVRRGTALGELEHPAYSSELFRSLNVPNISHQVLRVWWRGKELWGTLEVLPTPSGLLLWRLYERGAVVGVSSRSWASLVRGRRGVARVADDMRLITFDFVVDPSNSGALLLPLGARYGRRIPDQTRAVELSHLGVGSCAMEAVGRLPAPGVVLEALTHMRQQVAAAAVNAGTQQMKLARANGAWQHTPQTCKQPARPMQQQQQKKIEQQTEQQVEQQVEQQPRQQEQQQQHRWPPAEQQQQQQQEVPEEEGASEEVEGPAWTTEARHSEGHPQQEWWEQSRGGVLQAPQQQQCCSPVQQQQQQQARQGEGAEALGEGSLEQRSAPAARETLQVPPSVAHVPGSLSVLPTSCRAGPQPSSVYALPAMRPSAAQLAAAAVLPAAAPAPAAWRVPALPANAAVAGGALRLLSHYRATDDAWLPQDPNGRVLHSHHSATAAAALAAATLRAGAAATSEQPPRDASCSPACRVGPDPKGGGGGKRGLHGARLSPAQQATIARESGEVLEACMTATQEWLQHVMRLHTPQ